MRFTRIHVLVIGLIVIVALAVAFGMAYARPQLAALSETRDQVEEQRTVAYTMLPELRKLADAQANYELKEQQTYAYMSRMPEISTDRYQGMIDLWKEYASTSGPRMVHYVIRQPGVIAPTGFSLPPPPTTPLDPIPIITVPVGDFGIRAASLPAIIAFLRAIGKAPRMATVSNVSISGSSPSLSVSMPLTMYLVTRWGLPGPGEKPVVAAPAETQPGGGRPTPPRGDDDDDDDDDE